MKKVFFVTLLLIFALLLINCNTNDFDAEKNDSEKLSDFKLLEEKNGVVYFNHLESTPQMTLKGESETEIKSEKFFETLVRMVNGKTGLKDICNCEAVYVIKVGSYTFGLHTHGISIYNGDSIKFNDLIISVDLRRDNMNHLFNLLKATLYGEQLCDLKLLEENDGIKRISVTTFPESASNSYSFNGDKAKVVFDFLNDLSLITNFEENPDEYGGMTWNISIEYNNGDTVNVYLFGNMFIRVDSGYWYKMIQEEASRFDKLLTELNN